MIIVSVPGVTGDCKIKGFDGKQADKKTYFTAESFSFGVQREMAESAKSGTSDITIGVGELQECTLSKSMDAASPYLARKAISGSSVGTVEVKFLEAITLESKQGNVVFLHFKLDNAFVKSWTMSGDADGRPTEDVALWYNKIAFQYFTTTDGKVFKTAGTCEWDHVESRPWEKPDLTTSAEGYDDKGASLW